jgi:hypothetical protein
LQATRQQGRTTASRLSQAARGLIALCQQLMEMLSNCLIGFLNGCRLARFYSIVNGLKLGQYGIVDWNGGCRRD